MVEYQGTIRVREVATPAGRPILGWFPGENDRPLMVNHNGYDEHLRYSNETVVAEEYDAEGNHIYSKVILPLHRRPDWQKRIEQMNSFRILEALIQEQFGFCDTGTSPKDGRVPYADNEIPWGVSIDCGGNRRNGIHIINKAGTYYVQVETQDWNETPNQSITYASDPQLCMKQVDASGDRYDVPFWRTSEVGDCVVPWVSNVAVVHWLGNVTFYPGYQDITKPFQPFECLLFGSIAHVAGYCFTGSETWLDVDGGELQPGWYQADGHRVPDDRSEPTPGTDKDYFCNVAGVRWPMLTPLIANWHKE